MPSFGARSRKNLDTCDERLIVLLEECIQYFDFSVIEGHRTTEIQKRYYADGKSKLDGVNQRSKHQATPSLAVDVMPYPPTLHGKNVWQDRERWYLFIGRIKGVADMLKIDIRVGADWNGDGSTSDQSFHDLPHIEISV